MLENLKNTKTPPIVQNMVPKLEAHYKMAENEWIIYQDYPKSLFQQMYIVQNKSNQGVFKQLRKIKTLKYTNLYENEKYEISKVV